MSLARPDGNQGNFNMTNEMQDRAAMRSLTIEELDAVIGGSTGSGAGKVTFNPFSITRKIVVASS